jgi:hypothetical protein
MSRSEGRMEGKGRGQREELDLEYGIGYLKVLCTAWLSGMGDVLPNQDKRREAPEHSENRTTVG